VNAPNVTSTPTIFWCSRRHLGGIRTQRIGPAAVDRLPEQREFRRHHQDIGPLHGNPVAGFDDRAVAASYGLVVVEPDSIHGLDAVAVIEEPADRNHLRKCREAAFMVAVPMTDDQMVDPLQAGVLRRLINSLRVTVAICKPGVEQHGFT
jgi:hypothetical protein